MPRVWEGEGWVIYIYPNDHAPKHVHVFRGGFGGPELEVNLEDLSIRDSHMTTRDARRALAVVAANREFLLAEWDRIQPSLNRF